MSKLITMISLALAAMLLAAAPATAQTNPDNLPYSDADPSHWVAIDTVIPLPFQTTGNSTDFSRSFTAYNGAQVVFSDSADCDTLSLDYEFYSDVFYITGQDGETGEEECAPYDSLPHEIQLCAYSPNGFESAEGYEVWVRDGTGINLAPFGQVTGEWYGSYDLDADGIVFDDTVDVEWQGMTVEIEQSGTVEFEDTARIYSSTQACMFSELQS